MHAIMDERYARNGMILILECRYAGQPYLKIMASPSLTAHDSYSMIPHTPVGKAVNMLASYSAQMISGGHTCRAVSRAGFRLLAVR